MKKQKKQGRRARRSFTPEFKADAVRLVKSGKTVAEVARELDLTETALREWVRRAEADAGERPGRADDRGAAGARASSSGSEDASTGARNPKSGGHLLRQGERNEDTRSSLRSGWPSAVAVLCRVLGVSRSGFYDYLAEPETSGSTATRASPPRRGPCSTSTWSVR